MLFNSGINLPWPPGDSAVPWLPAQIPSDRNCFLRHKSVITVEAWRVSSLLYVAVIKNKTKRIKQLKTKQNELNKSLLKATWERGFYDSRLLSQTAGKSQRWRQFASVKFREKWMCPHCTLPVHLVTLSYNSAAQNPHPGPGVVPKGWLN